MSYVEDNLLQDEKLVFLSHPHWIVFAPGFCMVLIAAAFWAFGPMYWPLQSRLLNLYPLYNIAAAASAIVAVYWLLTGFIDFNFSEYAVTNHRVIMKTGWFYRTTLELFLRKLEGINANQTLLGRFLNYGSITIIGTGGTQDTYSDIPDPFNFHQVVQQQMDQVIDRDDVR